MKNINDKKRPKRIMDSKDKRHEVVHVKVNAREKLGIYMTAKKCGMTVSSYLRARALGYEPIARLNADEKLLISKLTQCRADIANFINAINGLTSEEKRKLFHNRQLMEAWCNEVKPIADAVSLFIRDVKNMKMRYIGTTNIKVEEGCI